MPLSGDERILAGSDFVAAVLKRQKRQLQGRHRLSAVGYVFGNAVSRSAELFGVIPEYNVNLSKQRQRATARSLVCYLTVKELGMSGTQVGKKPGQTHTAVSRVVQRDNTSAISSSKRT
jgi:chromosomal replication initiation ATPase DnaA